MKSAFGPPFVLALCLLGFLSTAHAADRLLADLFQDHAVLQRGKPIEVYGKASPGAAISVSLAKNSATAKADANGHWRASLPPLEAGGPYTLTAKSGRATATAKDVLVGDVWLCAGQSNMVLQVHRTNDSRSEIQNANNDRIRVLMIGEADSAAPLDAFPQPVEWKPTNPQTVRDFPATCYYFVRELQKVEDVPMGVVNAAWGGSMIWSWMSHAGVADMGGMEAELETAALYADDASAAARRWGEVWENWWKERAGPEAGEPWSETVDAAGWKEAPSVGAWDKWGDPAFTEFVGMGWYRTNVNLTAKQAAQAAMLSLGGVDEIDFVWVNGTPVGGGSAGDRSYALPKGTLREGENTIAVNVLNTYKMGGLIGPAEKQAIKFADGSSAALAGPWHVKAAPLSAGFPPRSPWEALGGVSMAYNAMIAPIGPYGFKGAVWYQGEANTSDGDVYEGALTALMADWRRTYGPDLPFLVVQLHGYGMPPTAPQESGWAELREAQQAAVAADDNAALVATVDISDPFDVHPANKQEVGRRLTRAARHVAYGEDIIATGPTAISATRKGKSVRVQFGDIEQGLVVRGWKNPIGFELCGEEEGSCDYADAELDGNAVTLTVKGKSKPARIRYCWADSPICTLFDKSGLPAGPFELKVEE